MIFECWPPIGSHSLFFIVQNFLFMGKQPFISHAVNGYSRYDVPENKAFSCTPGILYPVRIDFINARDRVTIAQGIDVRSNPLAVPSFNPYTVRLHRFWVPMQLYHPEMRTNSSKFDMNNVSLNWLLTSINADSTAFGDQKTSYPNSLYAWLRIGNRTVKNWTPASGTLPITVNDLPASMKMVSWTNADTYLAYWDIVRNYYSYSQWGLYSFASPASWMPYSVSSDSKYSMLWASKKEYFYQGYGNLEYLDAYFESQFYPSSVTSTNNTYRRDNLFAQIIRSNLSGSAGTKDGYPVPSISDLGSVTKQSPKDQFDLTGEAKDASLIAYAIMAHPMAVVPANPDRFSRLIPRTSSSDVSMSGVSTIPQLAIASRLQEYKDLLGAGGSRYSDWLETFFASRIEHVDRPKLLFSASQTVNVQVVMNQAGVNNFNVGSGLTSSIPLGQQGGAIAFNTRLGRRQSYYFREPGYMIDMLSIRPVYYWANIRPDHLNYVGADYFNPVYNDIGYQDVPVSRIFNTDADTVSVNVVALEPAYNEFRASYDEVLGQLANYSGLVNTSGRQTPLYAYWVQQRQSFLDATSTLAFRYARTMFVDLASVNSPFASNMEDNFFVNMSYSVFKKNLVNKTFATRLSNR